MVAGETTARRLGGSADREQVQRSPATSDELDERRLYRLGGSHADHGRERGAQSGNANGTVVASWCETRRNDDQGYLDIDILRSAVIGAAAATPDVARLEYRDHQPAEIRRQVAAPQLGVVVIPRRGREAPGGPCVPNLGQRTQLRGDGVAQAVDVDPTSRESRHIG